MRTPHVLRTFSVSAIPRHACRCPSPSAQRRLPQPHSFRGLTSALGAGCSRWVPKRLVVCLFHWRLYFQNTGCRIRFKVLHRCQNINLKKNARTDAGASAQGSPHRNHWCAAAQLRTLLPLAALHPLYLRLLVCLPTCSWYGAEVAKGCVPDAAVRENGPARPSTKSALLCRRLHLCGLWERVRKRTRLLQAGHAERRHVLRRDRQPLF